jgi:hypothetical protein
MEKMSNLYTLKNKKAFDTVCFCHRVEKSPLVRVEQELGCGTLKGIPLLERACMNTIQGLILYAQTSDTRLADAPAGVLLSGWQVALLA